MATAPPGSRLPLFSSDLLLPPHFRAHALPFYSPTPKTTSDSGYRWTSTSTSMLLPPESSVFPQRTSQSPNSMTKTKCPSDGGGGGLKFITATSDLNEFRKKENMTTVRKQAMDHHLTSEGKEPRRRLKAKSHQPLSNVPSDASSVISQDMAVASSMVPTTPSITATSRASMSSYHDAYASSQRASPVGRRQSSEGVLDAAPIVEPSRQGPLRYDAHPPPLFQSIGKPLDPFGTMFQASHSKVSVEHLKRDCSMYFGTKSLGKWWIPTVLSHPHTFLGTLCLATAYNDVVQELASESVQTIALRQEVIHLVGQKILIQFENIADHNFMAVLQLIISEIIGREESGLEYHLNGIEKMISLRGGLSQITELDGRLANCITWICISCSILHEKRAGTMYLDHATAHSRNQYPPTATIPASPLYMPSSHKPFQTLQKMSGCSAKAIDLIVEVKTMVDMFLHETKQAGQSSGTLMTIYGKITDPRIFPPISRIPYPRTEADYRYEAIRIAAVIQATAIAYGLPLSKAIHQVVELESSNLPSLYTHSNATRSNESLVSPNDLRRNSQVLDTTSPTCTSQETSPSWQTTSSYFFRRGHQSSVSSLALTHRSSQSSNETRPSVSTARSSASISRPSPSSMQPASSDYTFFPTTAKTDTQTDVLLREIRNAITKSDMSNCWENMAGVLLWVGLVVGAATNDSDNKILRRYFSAITMRCGIMLCFEHPEGINATVLRMSEIVEALDDTQIACTSSKTDRAAKRHRP